MGSDKGMVTDGDTKSCKVCAEEIKKAARVCIHCNNYQDWRAEIGISQSVLSLLVALLSVLTVAAPVLVSTFTPKNSSFAFTFEAASASNIAVFIANSGSRSGVIRMPVRFAVTQLNGKPVSMALSVTGASTAIFIDAGKSLLLQLSPPADSGQTGTTLADFFATNGKPDRIELDGGRCTLTFTVNDFQGVGSPKEEDVDCKELSTFVAPINERLAALAAKQQ
jgi:hypothetical protein